MLGSDGAIVANCMSRRPVITSVIDWDELLYGTWLSDTPAMLANRAVARCARLATPAEP